MASRRTVTTRETKVTTRRPGAAETDPSAPSAGMSMTDAVVIVTAVMLIAAILLTDYHLGHDLNSGVFFKP
jgi:hypothetical protein